MRTFRRAPAVLHDVLDDRTVLIDALGTELITLNPVGALVWQTLDGERDTGVVAEHLAGLFKDVEPAVISRDVESFLDELEGLSLVEPVDGAREAREQAQRA